MRCGDSLLLYMLVQVTSGLYGAEWGYILDTRFAFEHPFRVRKEPGFNLRF